MKYLRYYIFFFAALIGTAMFTSCSDDDEEVVIKDDDEEGDDSDDDGKGGDEVVVPDSIARAVAAKFGLGWNLGNQLDAHNNGVAQEDCWGNKIATQTLFDKVAEAGFKSVRIPVTWLGHVGAAPDYKIDEVYLDRVAEVVGYAKNAGLNAIINIHHDGFRQSKDELQPYTWLDIQNAATDPAVNERVKAQLAAMWTQIAERFKDEGDYLMFESMNEVQDGGWGWGDNLYDGGRQYAVLNEWNQLFVDVVRATGGNNATRYLGVPGYSTNIDLTVGNFVLPTDVAENKLLVSVHFYEPNDYSLNAIYSEWGHTASPSSKAPNGDEDNVRAQFNKVKTTFINNNIPVYVGEFGCVHRADPREEAFRLYYLEYVCKAAKDYGMAAFYWDNGDAGAGAEKSGLFDRATGDLQNNAQEVIDVMKRGYFTDDPSYTLQSVFENAPQ